jgi:hypothetical protein
MTTAAVAESARQAVVSLINAHTVNAHSGVMLLIVLHCDWLAAAFFLLVSRHCHRQMALGLDGGPRLSRTMNGISSP